MFKSNFKYFTCNYDYIRLITPIYTLKNFRVEHLNTPFYTFLHEKFWNFFFQIKTRNYT
jgi:hypothetical protein